MKLSPAQLAMLKQVNRCNSAGRPFYYYRTQARTMRILCWRKLLTCTLTVREGDLVEDVRITDRGRAALGLSPVQKPKLRLIAGGRA